MSKTLATIATQPLIVAKVGLQSKPPPSREGKPFKSFIEVMQFIIQNEGPLGLFKGIAPQIMKGLLVQGFLMMTKERYVETSRLGRGDTNLISQNGATVYRSLQVSPETQVRTASESRRNCCIKSKAGSAGDSQVKLEL